MEATLKPNDKPALHPGMPLLALGFRPFYLLASSFAALSILLWIGVYSGVVPNAYHGNPVWHAHEMIYGFTVAVIVGFLFTASRNWTSHPTPTGTPLAALAMLWVAGRVAVLTPWTLASAVVNVAFPVLAALALAVPLARSRNRRNYFFVAVLLAIGSAELCVHLSQAGLMALPPLPPLHAALDLILFIIVLMAGRVVPMFTNNGVPGANAKRVVWVERTSLGTVLLLLAADMAGASTVTVVLLIIATVSHGARLALWKPWRTVHAPLVWILHAGYAWIVLHFAIRILAQYSLVPEPLSTHAFTIGGIGSFTIGMMMRTAKGHTGRPLIATKPEMICYLLVQGAAVVRVFGGMILPAHYVATIVVSGLCWAAAFACYAALYWPVLSRPRLDGKPG